MSEPAKEQKSIPKGRIHLLDELRGFAVICMVFFHAFFSVGYFFHWDWGITLVQFFYPAVPYFAGLFIFISGIASNLSHSNIDRGTRLFFVAYIVTLVSFFAVGNADTIRFGILHMLSICMMLYGLLSRIIKHIPMMLGIIFNLILFILTYTVSEGFLSIPFLWKMPLPAEWYNTDFLYPLGFVYDGFTSGDFYPLLPWIFLFFIGTFFGRLAVQKKLPKFTYKSHIKPFAFVGRHALIIYLAHQPLIFGICQIVQMIISITGRH